MSNSVQPHRQQPTRLPHPWDSPGKNTGVGCHFLLQCMKAKSESEVAQLCPTQSDPMDCSLPVSFVHGIFQARVLEWVAIAFFIKHFGGLVKTDHRDSPGGPLVKNPPCNAGDARSMPGQGAKLPHATDHLSPTTAITEPVSHNWSPCAAVKDPARHNKRPTRHN